jgi:hypothetical protein
MKDKQTKKELAPQWIVVAVVLVTVVFGLIGWKTIFAPPPPIDATATEKALRQYPPEVRESVKQLERAEIESLRQTGMRPDPAQVTPGGMLAPGAAPVPPGMSMQPSGQPQPTGP